VSQKKPRVGRASLLRVKKPSQNPATTPKTIDSCSSAMSDPRSSGGLISAMYKGESMLKRSCVRTR
jgi:hypothetical protein